MALQPGRSRRPARPRAASVPVGKVILVPPLALALLLAACSSSPDNDNGAVASAPANVDGQPDASADLARYEIQVLGTYPHDETSWTEGLEFHDGLLLESVGLVGQSSLRLTDPRTGEIQHLTPVGGDLYAEGVTVVDGNALQLTWQNETLLTTALPDLDQGSVEVRPDAYEGEGWGLCYNGTDLVMSDGSDQLQFRDPSTFDLRRSQPVTLRGAPLDQINELECVDGQVWANIWLTTTIVVIDPTTGAVTGTADVSALVPEEYQGSTDAVANGIAHDPDTDTFWLTGKLWPVIYEVRFTNQPSS